MEQKKHKSILHTFTPYLLIAPTFILVFLFTIYPAIQTAIDSTYKFIPEGRARMLDRPAEEFVGLENYQELLDETHYIGGRFRRILSNTFTFTFGTVLIAIPLSLVMALLLNRKIQAMGVWRFSLFYPVLLPLIGAANIWAFLYSDTVGLINTVLDSFGVNGPDWVGDPDMVLFSVIIVNIWKQTGFYMIFYLAALQGISKDFYEASELDGANYFQQLMYLTLPLVRRTTLFIMVVSSTYAFQTVEQLQALNQGNPADRGNLLLYFIFQNLGSRDSTGYINAMTVVLVAILLIFTGANFFLFEGGRDDDA